MISRVSLVLSSILGGLTSPALAQSVTVSLHHDDADGIVNAGDTVTWTLSVGHEGFTPGSVASGMNAAILASDSGLVSSSDMAYNGENTHQEGFGANGGYLGGESDRAGGISFIHFTNSLFLEVFGTSADHHNPFIVGTFTTTALNPGTLDYALAKGQSTLDFVSIDASAFATFGFGAEEVKVQIDTLTIIPAPASALLLAELLVARRRH